MYSNATKRILIFTAILAGAILLDLFYFKMEESNIPDVSKIGSEKNNIATTSLLTASSSIIENQQQEELATYTQRNVQIKYPKSFVVKEEKNESDSINVLRLEAVDGSLSARLQSPAVAVGLESADSMSKEQIQLSGGVMAEKITFIENDAALFVVSWNPDKSDWFNQSGSIDFYIKNLEDKKSFETANSIINSITFVNN